jgi:putative ABC transport system ATP-binding protein
LEPTLIGFVWRHARLDQLKILLVTALSFPLLYLSLELPKIIVNDAIGGPPGPRAAFGYDLDRIDFLLALCGFFLATVAAINALKWVINVGVGMCGERMLRRLRQTLFERALRFPPARFAATSPGEITQSILGESEPLGGFIGEVLSTPVFQGGMLAVYIGFIFAQDRLLGLAATALLPVQMLVIPRLQRRVVRLNRERAATQRRVAESISEPVIGFDDVVTNGAGRWRLARLSALLHANTMIRQALFRRKFAIKMIGNLFNQLTPFLFFSIGGWLVIVGRLDLGALVAVLAAYKDIAKPWRELLNYYQRLSDFRGRYAFLIDSFSGDDVLPPERVYGDGTPGKLSAPLRFDRVEGGAGAAGLTVAALDIPARATVALVAETEAAGAAFLRLAAGLAAPAQGRVTLGGRALATAPTPLIGASIGYVAAEPALARGTMRENLLYGLFHDPPPLRAGGAARREAEAAGAPLLDPDGDWTAYALAEAGGPDDLDARLIALAREAGMGAELIAAALETRLDADQAAAWGATLRAARDQLRAALAAAGLEDAVAPWARGAFNRDGSALANILFAPPPETEAETRALLRRIGAEPVLAEIGWALGAEFAEGVATVGRDSGVLDSLGGFTRAEALAAVDIVESNRAGGVGAASAGARAALAEIAARFTPARDRFELVDDALESRILALREKALAARPRVAPFNAEAVSPGATIAETFLGGPRRHARRAAWRRLDALMLEAAEASGVAETLLRLAFDAPLGGGVSGQMRRRIGLVRALIKRPTLLILNGPGAGDDEADRALRALARRAAPEAILLYLSNEAAAAGADIALRIGADGALATPQTRSAPDEH